MDGVALAVEIAERAAPAYQRLGRLSFVYGQGSVVAGFTEDSDLDLVFVWARDEPPSPAVRPAALLNEAASAPVQWHQPGFYLDRFWVGRQQVDASHVPERIFDEWLAAVMAGGGWEGHAYPQPLAAIAGFAYGVHLADETGRGRAARERVAAFPPALAGRSRALLAEHLPGYVEMLAGCARRGDGWLFHELLGAGLKEALVAWFAGHGRYLPFHKWLQRWIARFALDPAIADLERQLWLPGADLGRKLGLFSALAQHVLETRAAPSRAWQEQR